MSTFNRKRQIMEHEPKSTAQDEIIEMARQAGFNLDATPNMLYTVRGNYAQLRAFAKLVAAKAIAKLESQEPVGWIDSKGNMICVKINESCRPLYTHPPQRTEPKVCCQQYDTCLEPCTPRGEHLAQRTWIGLTDDEFNELYDKYVPINCYALLIEKVEAKLKEKNT